MPVEEYLMDEVVNPMDFVTIHKSFGTLDITEIRHFIPNLPNGYAVDITVPGIDVKTNQKKNFDGCLLKYSESDFCLIIEV